ncbi:MAG: hypothetical protein SCI25_09525 [Desulfuromonadales bacterium]|nr:hypothetical protein [Desulfuromonadales bacterium]MDW7756689.1 hypothetical protein [Desulfuromonadales bacterium]
MRFPLKTICLFALLGALSLLTSSCAPHTPASSSPSSLNLPAPEANRDDSLVQKQQKLLSQGDYLAALNLADNGKGDSAELLRRALPGAYRQGEQMLAAQHYAEAGATFAYLLSLVKESEATVTGGEVSGEELTRKRDFCAEQLMVQGMTAYRNGLLEEAIGTWEQILAFAPDHEGAHKSLATSRTQLSNLQALKKEDI